MKIEQRGNSYRVRKTYKNKTYCLNFDHKPTQREVALRLAEVFENSDVRIKGSFFYCVDEYIKSKDNVLSPTTIRSYRQMSNYFPKYLDKNVLEITQLDIQNAINGYAIDHSPKSVKNYHGLISAVMKMYRPNFCLHTTLPKGKPTELSIPSHEEITQILKEVEGTQFHIVFQLGCMGLRKGEILALNLTDLEGDVLTIDKTMVLCSDGVYRVKNLPKTVSSVRKVVIPDTLANEIRELGYIYEGDPQRILRTLHRTQDKLDIKRCRFHDLRHYFVSYAHSLGYSDADIISVTGHKTDEIARRVYRHSMANKEDKKNLANKILG